MFTRSSIHATVHGIVQGVFFRAYIKEKARELGLTGFVRNLPTGRDLEVVAEGEKEKLETLLDYLKVGPPAAKVEKVTVTWSRASGKYPQFFIKG